MWIEGSLHNEISPDLFRLAVNDATMVAECVNPSVREGEEIGNFNSLLHVVSSAGKGFNY